MSCQRCLQILIVCMMLVLTGEMVFARGGVLLDESDHNATTAQEKKPQPISRMELQKDLMLTTGPDAVVNLLDMVIFVTLGRMAVENSWKPELLGKSKGGLPKFTGRWKKRSGPSPERC